jgi:hypothetical protein
MRKKNQKTKETKKTKPRTTLKKMIRKIKNTINIT